MWFFPTPPTLLPQLIALLGSLHFFDQYLVVQYHIHQHLKHLDCYKVRDRDCSQLATLMRGEKKCPIKNAQRAAWVKCELFRLPKSNQVAWTRAVVYLSKYFNRQVIKKLHSVEIVSNIKKNKYFTVTPPGKSYAAVTQEEQFSLFPWSYLCSKALSCLTTGINLGATLNNLWAMRWKKGHPCVYQKIMDDQQQNSAGYLFHPRCRTFFPYCICTSLTWKLGACWLHNSISHLQ